MISKRVLLICLLASLSACSVLPVQNDEANTLPSATQPPSSMNDANEAAPEALPENIVLAQSMFAKADAFAATKRALSASTKAQVQAVLSLYQQNQLDRAQTQINQLIANELNINSAVHVLAGDIALAKNELKQASVHYQKALNINANNAKAANRLGILMRDQGQFDKAQSLYSQAISAQPGHANSYRNRAILRDLYLNEKALALADYQAYEALLAYRKLQSDEGSLVLNQQQAKALKSNQKLVKRWLADVGRQVKALARAAAKKAQEQK